MQSVSGRFQVRNLPQSNYFLYCIFSDLTNFFVRCTYRGRVGLHLIRKVARRMWLLLHFGQRPGRSSRCRFLNR